MFHLLYLMFPEGWGKDIFGPDGSYQVVMKEVDVPMVPHGDCQTMLRNTPRLPRQFKLDKSFVCAGGEAGRPPVQWSSTPTHLLLANGYLVALGVEGLSVHGLEDQELRQGISFPGGRWAGLCDGTLLLCTGTSVACLSELPWEQQAQAQLEAGELEKAVSLAEGKGAEGKPVLCRAAFLYIQKGKWETVAELLLKGGCDPREVVSLVPDLLPSNSK